MYAAQLEEKDAIMELVARGANVHFESRTNQTALLLAAQEGRLHSITVLVRVAGLEGEHTLSMSIFFSVYGFFLFFRD